DLDLLDSGIAFDVKNAIAREKVCVEFLSAANIQDGVGFAVELADFFQRQSSGRVARQITRAKTPAVPEAEFGGEMLEDARSVIEFVVHLESVRVVRQPGGIFDVEDIVAESLQADDVMNVLPDDAGDRAGTHEAHDDETLSFHGEKEGGNALTIRRRTF